MKNICCPLLRKIRVLNRLPKIQISISGAYFSGLEFEADFLNRFGQKQPFSKRRHWLEWSTF